MTKYPYPKQLIQNPIPVEERIFKCAKCLNFFKWPEKKDDYCKACWDSERDMDKFDLGDSGDEC